MKETWYVMRARTRVGWDVELGPFDTEQNAQEALRDYRSKTIDPLRVMKLHNGVWSD